MANSDLASIRKKVRRLTGRPSENQLSTSDIDDYINTFYRWDLPAELKLLDLKKTYSFITEPDIDIYDFTPNDINTIEPPVYVGGNIAAFTQNREYFFSANPEIQADYILTTGANVVGPYTATVNATPIKRNRVIVSTVDVSGASLTATDALTEGVLAGDVLAGATIDYDTGVIANLNFTGIIGSGTKIMVQYINYSPSRPSSVLFYDNKIQLSPVPDKAYRVMFDAYVNPTALAAATSEPELRQWWQLIALGAAMKIFEDNLDMENYGKVRMFYEEQLVLVDRKTTKELSLKRVETIYSSGVIGIGTYSTY